MNTLYAVVGIFWAVVIVGGVMFFHAIYRAPDMDDDGIPSPMNYPYGDV